MMPEVLEDLRRRAAHCTTHFAGCECYEYRAERVRLAAERVVNAWPAAMINRVAFAEAMHELRAALEGRE